MALVLSLLPVVILINNFIGTSAFGVDESEHGGEKLQDYLSKLRKIRMLKRKESNMDARLFEASLTALETTNLSSVTQINKPGFGNIANKYSLSMASFKGHVYVGTLNAPNFPDDLLPWFMGEQVETEGAQVWRGLGSGNMRG